MPYTSSITHSGTDLMRAEIIQDLYPVYIIVYVYLLPLRNQ